MLKGKLIVIEGACDGVGKSTQCCLLEENIKSRGGCVVKHHFPTCGEPQGDGVKRYLSGEFGDVKDLSPYFVNSLYAHDRAIVWREKLMNEYQSGKTILLDRYTTSSLIYQSALIDDVEKKKEFIDYVCDFEYKKLGIKEPDLVLFLCIPFELALKNREDRKKKNLIEDDIHERDVLFMKKVYDSALFVANYLGWKKIVCNNGDEMKPIEEINEEIMRACLDFGR